MLKMCTKLVLWV